MTDPRELLEQYEPEETGPMTDPRELLELYAEESVQGGCREEFAPRAFSALGRLLDYADYLEKTAYAKWVGPYPPPEQAEQRGHHIGVMETEHQEAIAIRAAIADALEGGSELKRRLFRAEDNVQGHVCQNCGGWSTEQDPDAHCVPCYVRSHQEGRDE